LGKGIERITRENGVWDKRYEDSIVALGISVEDGDFRNLSEDFIGL
jgi:hypothetical protein